MKNILLGILPLIILTSCGSGGTSTTDSNISSGFISAAPINNATCDIFKVSAGTKTGVSLQTVSSSLGKVEFKDIDYSGTALIECVGGKYNDEATDTELTQPTLRAVVNFSPTGSFAITPLTEIATQMDSNLDNVLGTHNASVANAFGLSDIISIKPSDLTTNLENTNSGKYATILAMLSQYDADNASSLTTTITLLKNDLADGDIIDNRDKILNAFTNIKATTKNISTKLNHSVINNLRQSIANNNFTARLNDTGITWGGDYPSGNNADCTGETISAQDCSSGRDAGLTLAYSTFTYAAGVGTTKTAKVGGGSAGFDFTKLGSDGTPLTIQTATWSTGGAGSESAGTKWSCVKDNVTGLVWEVKTDSGVADSDTTDSTHTNIHHKDNRYRWGGKTAIGKNATTPLGTYYDDWTGLVDGANSEKLCGFDDWRVPNINQLASIVHKGKAHPAIDENYFPNTPASIFWPSSPSGVSAWFLDFYGNDDVGLNNIYSRTNAFRVRLVRSK